MLVLYHDYNSYASQKVRLYLAEKNICYESQHLDLLKQEHLTAAYQKINPRGLVPALNDAGKIVVNSTDIMKYIEDKYVSDSSCDIELAQQLYDFCKQDEGLHDPHIRVLSYHYLWMDSEKSPDEINRILILAQQHPDKARGAFLSRAVQRQITAEEISHAKQAVITALDDMEQRLRCTPSGFLFGDAYTMADSVATARLFRLHRLNFAELIQQYPLTSSYYEAMKKRDSFLAAKIMENKSQNPALGGKI
jgi:glutathione S-transferase